MIKGSQDNSGLGVSNHELLEEKCLKRINDRKYCPDNRVWRKTNKITTTTLSSVSSSFTDDTEYETMLIVVNIE